METEFKIFEELDLKESSILEIGCGDGRVSEFLVQRCKNFVGVDLDEEAISNAKNRVGKGKFLVADGQDLPFKDVEFDGLLKNLGGFSLQELSCNFKFLS